MALDLLACTWTPTIARVLELRGMCPCKSAQSLSPCCNLDDCSFALNQQDAASRKYQAHQALSSSDDADGSVPFMPATRRVPGSHVLSMATRFGCVVLSTTWYGSALASYEGLQATACAAAMEWAATSSMVKGVLEHGTVVLVQVSWAQVGGYG